MDRTEVAGEDGCGSGNENDLARFRVEVVFIPALTYFPGDRRPEYLRRWWA
jgi:hypothetical protein